MANLSDRLREAAPVHPAEGHSPDRERPLGGYIALMGTFLGSSVGFATWFHRSGRELPDSISARDLAMVTVASHKAARIVTKDRVASAVRAPFTRYQDDSGGPGETNEAARGRGLRRAVGELLVCPYCLGMWTSAGFTASLLVFPRFTRWVAAVLIAFFGSELLQVAYVRAERLLDE